MKNYNARINGDAVRLFNLKGEGIPDEVEGPVAVIPIQPVANISRARSGAGTIYTTPTEGDFYITGFWISFSKTAGDTGSVIYIRSYIDGVAQVLLEVATITLTADAQTATRELTVPLRVDRGVVIESVVTGSVTSAKFGVTGYVDKT